MPTLVYRTSTIPVMFGFPMFSERVVYGAGYGVQQVFGGPSPPLQASARTCAYDHSVWGDANTLTAWSGSCAPLGAGRPDATWPGTYNAFVSAGLSNSKDDALPFIPTSYTVSTTKTAMRLTFDTTSDTFAELINADLGGPIWAYYEVLSLTANLSFTHTTSVSGSGWSCLIRRPALAGPEPNPRWIKPGEVGYYPVLATLGPGGDGAASLGFVPDDTVPTSFRAEILAGLAEAEGSSVDLGYTPVSRSGTWQVLPSSVTVRYRYLPLTTVPPPLWQRQRIGVLDSSESFASGLVTPQSSPWQGGTL